MRAKNQRIDFAKAETQAKKAMRVIQPTGRIKSVGTNRNYRQCLQNVAQWVKDNKLGDLRQITQETAIRFLEEKASVYRKKTLNMHRQALQALFHAHAVLNEQDGLALSNALPLDKKLPIVKSKVDTVEEHRAYSSAQVAKIAEAQTKKNAFATRLAYAAGLRAHELLTLRPLSEQPADIRHYEDGSVKSLPSKWQGRPSGVPYSVIGKGGLIREVRIPSALAEELESYRLSTPVQVTDRNVHYACHYDIAGGQKWSNSFSAASSRVLGWSTGAHGLRHSYAQERLAELSRICPYEIALETVSQEMGHFRPSITETYLR